MFMRILAATGLVLSLAAGAHAQTYTLGTTAGGATGQVGTSIAQIATAGGEIRLIPQESANTAQYIPLVNAGRITFGIANYPQTYFAYHGTGMSEGQANPDLRMVATLMDFISGMLVYSDSGIETMADLAGRNVPRFPDNSLGDFVIRAVLATGGLTYDDVTLVPTANFPAMFDGMKDGSLDVSIATAGAAHVMDIQATGGDVVFVPLRDEDAPALDGVLPGTRVFDISDMEAEGVSDGTKIFGYDYMLFASAETPDEVVTAMLTSLYEGREALLAATPIWESFAPERMGRAAGLPYHPAAIAFFEEKGVPVPADVAAASN